MPLSRLNFTISATPPSLLVTPTAYPPILVTLSRSGVKGAAASATFSGTIASVFFRGVELSYTAILTVAAPTFVGVPLIFPDAASSDSPSGKPVASKE
ncbi:hypothetical protein D3C78_997760 [compost metagenome]